MPEECSGSFWFRWKLIWMEVDLNRIVERKAADRVEAPAPEARHELAHGRKPWEYGSTRSQSPSGAAHLSIHREANSIPPSSHAGALHESVEIENYPLLGKTIGYGVVRASGKMQNMCRRF